MVVKTITITRKAYEALAGDKKKDESFSELILRNYKRKGDISRFIGAWSFLSEEEANRIHKHIRDVRKRAGKHRRKELMRHLR